MPDPLKVECPHCGGSLKLKDRSADGRKVRCPKCQEIFKIQLPAEDDVEVLDDLMDDFSGEDDFPEEEPVPKKSAKNAKKSSKKKRKSSGGQIPWAIIGIAAAVIFVIGGAGLAISKLAGSSSANKINMTYLLADADSVVHFKVKELLESPLLASMKNQPQAQAMLNGPTANTVFDYNQMVSITVGWKAGNLSREMAKSMSPFGAGSSPRLADMQTVIVVRSSAATAPEKLTLGAAKFTSETHNGKTYQKKVGDATAGLGFGSVDSFYFPEPNVMVMAMESDMKRVIDQGATQSRRPEFDIINPGLTMLMAVTSTSQNNPDQSVNAPPTQPQLQAFERAVNKTVRGLVAGIKVTDRLDIEFLLKCADSAGAGEVKTAAEGVIADLKQQYEKSKQMLQLMGMEEVIGLADKSLASIKVDQSGSEVTTVAMIPSDIKTVVESVTKKMGGMGMGSRMPGGAGLGGPPGTSGGQATPPAGFDASQVPPGTLPGAAVPPNAAPPAAPANP